MGPAVRADRPRYDIGDLVRQHLPELEERMVLTARQRRVLLAVSQCRTAALGGHMMECDGCGYEHPVYNSCLDRHCPKCQATAQEAWIAARSDRVLPTRHFHVVFTLPSELRALASYRPRQIYNALFSAASATLLELSRSKYAATIGVTMILHTWARNMTLHPHVHAIVTAGGLSLDGKSWKPSSGKYLFSIKAMGKLLRGKMMASLRDLHAQGKFNGFHAFADPQAFDKLMARLARLRWVVHAKRPMPKVDHVLAYLGRYTHRVAISNSRLLDVTDRSVTIATKHGKTLTLEPTELVRRFAQHVLPQGFHKIRHFGLYSGAAARPEGKLSVARALLAPQATDDEPNRTQQIDSAVTCSPTPALCPKCGAELSRRPLARAPPNRPAP